MFTDSARNYLDGHVTLVYEGDVEPTREQINEYCQRNYGFVPYMVDVDPPCEGFGGYQNPGIVKCYEDRRV